MDNGWKREMKGVFLSSLHPWAGIKSFVFLPIYRPCRFALYSQPCTGELSSLIPNNDCACSGSKNTGRKMPLETWERGIIPAAQSHGTKYAF